MRIFSILITFFTLAFNSSVYAQDLMPNNDWRSVNNNVAGTMIGGNPSLGQEGISFIFHCYTHGDNALTLHVGDGGNAPRAVVNDLTFITQNRSQFVNNSDIGSIMKFSDGSVYRFPFVTISKVDHGNVTTYSTGFEPSMAVINKLKSLSWVDVGFYVKDDVFYNLKPFRLNNSARSINQVTECVNLDNY